MNTQQFKPPKSLWTQDDFEVMSWHDNLLHGIGIVDDFDPHEHEVRFDIDYIFSWSGHGGAPGPPGFWISPSTLVFPTRDFSIAIDGCENWIMRMERSNPKASGNGPITWTWEISLNYGGLIRIQSSEYKQYSRRTPIFVPAPHQCLESRQRGGFSFDKALYDA